MEFLKHFDIYELSCWIPEKSKLKKSWFFKTEILFGSDPDADVRVSGAGFIAKLNFLDAQLENLLEPDLSLAPPDKIFEVQQKMFCWRKRNFLKPAVSLFVLCLLGITSFGLGSNAESCNTEHARDIEFAFSKAIAERNIRLAGAELSRMKKVSCQDDSLNRMQDAYVEVLALLFLRRKEYVKAARLIAERKLSSDRDWGELERQVVSLSSSLRWQGWRLEKSDPEAAYAFNRKAYEICELLSLPSNCHYRLAARPQNQ